MRSIYICIRGSRHFYQPTIKIPSFMCNSHIHTTGFISSSRQVGNAMKKVLGVNRKKKFVHFDGTPTVSPESFSKGSTEGKHSVNSRRASVLNKLFMKHITDLMATGQYAPEIVGRGIEVNRVKINPDYKCLNVYWIARGSQDDEAVEEILHKNAGFLRHELSQLRVMGNVPKIQFIKDKRYAQMTELDNRLAVADFGEDHTPLDYTAHMKSEFELYAPLDDDIKKRIAKLDEDHPVDNEDDLPLPSMPQNVLGLDHAAIMNRIQKLVKKSEALHRQTGSADEADESWVTFKVNQSVNNEPVSFGSGRSQREAFREFLHHRQIQKIKAKRNQKNYIPGLEYLRDELENAHLENLNKFDINNSENPDFVIEDVDEK